MKEYYHYTLERCISRIQLSGVYQNHPYFTTTEYYFPSEAGQDLGVMQHNIDCVLKFADDGRFQKVQDVPSTTRFTGGGNQYQHPGRPKPIAVRKIRERNWQKLP